MSVKYVNFVFVEDGRDVFLRPLSDTIIVLLLYKIVRRINYTEQKFF